ncbi:MAG: YicC/YloC family endoribonuclease [Candidatus Caldatribacteriaceae bacterium]
MQSMTGFGYAEGEGALGLYRVYLKSLNHRFLEVSLRLPRELTLWEERVNALIRRNVSRGKVELRVDFEPHEAAFTFEVNSALAHSYFSALQKLSEVLSLPFEPKIEWFLELGDLVKLRNDTEVWIEEWKRFIPILERALSLFIECRKVEGQKLRKDLEACLAEVERAVQKIEERAGEVRDYYEKKLRKRLEEAMPQGKIDEVLLAQEVLFYVDRSDIHEEIVRLQAHIARARELLERDSGIVGRELEFLLQEIHREVNTIGSKSSSADISSLVVDVKTILERMWEQAHNVE